ncbi:MAG: DUF1294 domain-containing protein [Cephaloticoccus sp.]|nr:DUF1294 domain-containing protein [Cephaloticoccus sp.]MCF7761856.1 DUF1294 domain-containing protein [Cephaloticoccus sp.]
MVKSSVAPQFKPQGGVTLKAWFGLGLLLVLPGLALARLAGGLDWRVLFGIPVVLSTLTYFTYRSDKRSSESGDGRTPESTLHLGEFLGGWPGAFLAQRRYRHKNAKFSYHVIFWMIVALHQLVALDLLLGWQLMHGMIQLFQTALAS